MSQDSGGRAKLYADIARPIDSRCREMIQRRVIQAFREELQSAQQPGYVTRYDDFYEDAGPCNESDAPTPHSFCDGTPSSRTGSEQQDQFGTGIF